MRRSIPILAGLIGIFGLLCSESSPAGSPSLAFSVTPALRVRDAAGVKDIDLNQSFDEPLPVHLRGEPDGKSVRLGNCADYEKVRKRVNGSDNELDYAVVKLEGARCDALNVLRAAAVATRTALPAGDFLGWRDASQYPGTLWAAFSGEEAEKLAASGASLKVASGEAGLKAISGHFLELENRSAGIHLTLLGLGDVDHDGWQDAVVLVEGYAKVGSNTTARLAVLTKHEGDQAMREIPIGKLLP